MEGFLDDYAFFAQALIDLFEASTEASYLEVALDLARRGLRRFEDAEEGGFFCTLEKAPHLLLRMKDDYDGAEPSGNSVATDVLLRLAHLTGDGDFRAIAERSLKAFAPKIKAQAAIAPQLLVALGRSLAVPEQTVFRCAEFDDQAKDLLTECWQTFAPEAEIVVVTDPAAERLSRIAPFLGGFQRTGKITLYKCRDFVCELPRIIGEKHGANA